MKVHELGKEIGKPSKDIISKATSIGIELKGANSNIPEERLQEIKTAMNTEKPKITEEENTQKRKVPGGKPVISKEVARRRPMGKPVVSDEVANRVVGEDPIGKSEKSLEKAEVKPVEKKTVEKKPVEKKPVEKRTVEIVKRASEEVADTKPVEPVKTTKKVEEKSVEPVKTVEKAEAKPAEPVKTTKKVEVKPVETKKAEAKPRGPVVVKRAAEVEQEANERAIRNKEIREKKNRENLDRSSNNRERRDGDRPSYNRGDRPQGDRSSYNRGDRPQGDRSSYNRGDRPQGDRPSYNRGDRPQGDRPSYNRGDRPQGDRPQYNRGDRPQGDRPQYNRGDRPQGDRPQYNRGDRPQGDRPQYNRGDRPQGDRPSYNRGDRQQGDRPSYNRGDRGDNRLSLDMDNTPDIGAGIRRNVKDASNLGKKKEKDKNTDRNKTNKFAKGNGKDGKYSNRLSYYDGDLEKKTKGKKQQKVREEIIEEELITEDMPVGTRVINVPITVAGFCEQMAVSTSQVIMTLLKLGVVANVNQSLDDATVELLAGEMNLSIVIGKVEEEIEDEGIDDFEDHDYQLKSRPPIITVMGHVDHGKTSLLDAIRNTSVTDTESGGITQHIGASEVEVNGEKIVFLDTPGHEAFTAMRARGANITDIAILVVAADDSVKPQTIESISHAKAAGVPIVVAINKIDKPGANPDVVKQDLSSHGVVVEEWGGDVIAVPVSAKKGDGIVQLLEMVLLQAEVLELKANPDRLASGTIIEARLDKAKGAVATLLVTNGTLKTGQSIVAGTTSGKIRLMSNHKGDTIRKAGPATAVEILGLADVPAAGDVFNAVKSDRMAKEIAEKRKIKVREEVMARNSSSTLEELFSQIQEGETKDLNLIVKGDVRGSVGAVVTSLEKLSTENVKVKIVHSGVGAVTESDITLASTSGAIIIGFNVRPSVAVSSIADREGVQIKTYRIIYNIIDDITNAIKGMLDPEYEEVILGTVEIRDTFKVPNIGIIGGAYVTSGKVVRNAEVRLVRDGIVIHEGKISSLRRFKDDAKEVAQGFECGIGIENYNDIKEGDVIECFQMEEIKRV